MLRICIFQLLFISSQAIFAYSDLDSYWYQHRIYGNATQQVPTSQVMVFRDDSNNLSYKDVRDYDDNYFISLGQIENFEKQKTYWLKVSFYNSTKQDQDFILYTGDNAIVTAYVDYGTDKIDTLKSGYLVPVSQRDIQKGFQSRFKLSLEPQKLISLMIKVKSIDNYAPRFNMEVVPLDVWTQRTENKSLWESVFTSLMIILSVLGLSFYLYAKRIEFLFYSLYGLCNAIYFLFFHGFLDTLLFPEHPEYIVGLWLLPNLSGVFYFSFLRFFLNTKENFPEWDKYFKIVIWITLIAFIGNAIYATVTLDVFSAVILHDIINVVLSISVIVFVLSLRKMKTLEVRYFTVASIILVSVSLYAASQYLYDLDSSVLPYVQIGMSVEIMFFALGLGHKMKKLLENHSITQESLILQFVENEKLQSQITTELKEKVAERTHRINVQNVELRKARQEAERATKAKSEFLGVMSHEIRTPLNAIISLSHLMDIDNENEETQEYIDALKFSAESLNSLINDILDYNKIEVGKLRLEAIDFSLIDLLKNIRDSFKFKASSLKNELIFHISENTPDRIVGDPTRLTQIFNNLISNALKFTENGKVEVSVQLLGIKDSHVSLEFAVADTGIGIPEDKISEIFEDYEQASSETTRKYGGTGLGLAITQKLVALHQSHINVSSEEGQGTEFSFTIDFELPESFDLLTSNKTDTVQDLKRARILVVDDNHMNRLVLNRLFQKWNAEFFEASSGTSAYQKTNEMAFDLILMDIQMDDMDGFECAKRIKEDSTYNKNTRMIGMSAFGQQNLEESYPTSSLEEFISKPFDPKELLTKLVRYLSNEYKKN